MHRHQRQHHRVRLNPEPPTGAVYFDPWTLTCSPCQSGSVNYCQTVSPPVPTEGDGGGDFDWVLEAARRGGGAQQQQVMATPVSQCCVTEADPVTGQIRTVCDTTQGCGWVAGPHLSDQTSCKFTTDGAEYPTLQTCMSSNPGAVVGPAGGFVDWYPSCDVGQGQTSNCFYSNVDACLPGVFGKQRGQGQGQCAEYTCSSAGGVMSVDGRLSFPANQCMCSK